jgi:hypothetical protein
VETRQEMLEKAAAVVQKAKAEKRGMTPDEKDEVKSLLARNDVLRDEEGINSAVDALGKALTPRNGGGLYKAIKDAGYDRKSMPLAVVPSAVLRSKAAIHDGDIEYTDAVDKPAPGLGIASRYLYPEFRVEPVEEGATSIQTFRQSDRTLASPDDMLRVINDVTPKPETDTSVETVNTELLQVASVSTEIPNVFLESPAFAGFINDDLTAAWRAAVDSMVVDAIELTSPPAGSGADVLAGIVGSVELVIAAGYNPTTVALKSADYLELLLLADDGGYVGSKMDRVLARVKVVVAAGLTSSLVLDPVAAGSLYLSNVRFASFEENAGSTNSSTVRVESHGLFAVQRPDAISTVAYSA